MALSIDVKVLAGDLPQGKQRILLNSIKSAELQTEDKLKKLAGSAGWGFTGALVGGLLTGGIGLAVGGLAGILSGGNKTEGEHPTYAKACKSEIMRGLSHLLNHHELRESPTDSSAR
jgi:hypothetical protein